MRSLLLAAACLLASKARAQCPSQIRSPCSCATTRYEPVSVLCDRAASLADALDAIGRTTALIDSLVISNTPVAVVPPRAFDGLRMKRLVLRNNGLTGFEQRAFDGQAALTELEVRNNQLGEVPQIGAPSLAALRTLVLANCGITRLPQNAFANYRSRQSLRRLDLSANRIRSVHAATFFGLDQLTELSLDKNLLSQVPADALNQLPALEDLSLAVNNITQMPAAPLHLPNLVSLSLEVNSISYIPPDAFRQLGRLLYLYLSSNNFNSIDSRTFRHTGKLKVLAMGGCKGIEQIPVGAFGNTPELIRLELSECSIARLDPAAFRAIPLVQVIVLNKNKLNSVETATFQGLSRLVSLDLRANEIQQVADQAFSRLPALSHLDISSNKIPTLHRNTFYATFQQSNPPTTTVLFIYDNPWICDERLQWFRAWLQRNVDVVIDSPAYERTVCAAPQQLQGHRLRADDTSIGSTPAPPTAPTKKPDVGGTELLTGRRMSASVSLILGIILGIFVISVLLLMMVRYLVGRNRRKRKEEDEEVRRMGATSVISGYQSALGGGGGGGGAYPAVVTPEPGTLTYRNPHRQPIYNPNRPWYWWF